MFQSVSSVIQSYLTFLQPHDSQHTRPPCPSPTPGVYSNSCPSSWWCHPAISSSVVPFSSCPQSLPASGSFPVSQLFTWGGQSIGVSASKPFWVFCTNFLKPFFFFRGILGLQQNWEESREFPYIPSCYACRACSIINISHRVVLLLPHQNVGMNLHWPIVISPNPFTLEFTLQIIYIL